MTDKEREEIIAEIEKLISTEPRRIPQSVIFRSGVNTGLRMAVRIVKEKGEAK